MTADNKRIGANPSSSNSVSANAHWQRSPAPPEPPPRTFAAVSLKASEIPDVNEPAADDAGASAYREPPELLTVPEACTLLRISRWNLYRLIHQRQLKTVQLGRRRLIPRAAVAELIEKLQEEAR